MNLITAAIKTKEKVPLATGIPKHHPEYGRDHIMEMLEKIIHGKITGEKANRWLGWAQCAVCLGGGATLEELKLINFKA